ncbi:hypothetical protein L596_018984 [Steinernema carpocapsae]|uniref:Uncharacterized protein n=1 Tax=Steinernema carpocapsae TaxID=34508 RepID=A0A4V6A282_STECR|nr:hypothetical protein L596_018984 [Steinernema carpocapsae]
MYDKQGNRANAPPGFLFPAPESSYRHSPGFHIAQSSAPQLLLIRVRLTLRIMIIDTAKNVFGVPCVLTTGNTVPKWRDRIEGRKI